MCGWVGVFGAFEQVCLRRAAETLASRGPDGSGERVIADGTFPVGLAHRRLAILDPSPAGAQPMHDPDTGTTVVHNGEIYNFPQLRSELEAHGARFRSNSDTEVLLKGWSAWGDGLLDRIEGIFSFALVDERQRRVLLARDRVGVKPLYWAQVGGTLLAGSAPRAILALRPELRADLDRVALAQFLALLWIPHPRTPWTKIRKLPPGTALSFDDGRIRQWRYWEPPETRTSALDPAELRETLEHATSTQLLSDVPVGILLSGGLDSTLLLSLMVRHDHDSIHALTAGYSPASQRLELAPDDVRYARVAASEHPQVRLTSVELDGEACSDLDALSFHFDDPVADPAAITLYRLARASETKVLISGVGGEELFGGYPRHLALPAARFAAQLPNAVRSLCALPTRFFMGGRPGWAYVARRNAQKLARAVAGIPAPRYWRMMAQLTMAEVDALMPGYATQAFDELDGQSARLQHTSLGEALSFDFRHFLPNLNLAYVDKAAMAAGVEVRVPLLDERVVRLVTAADPTDFVRDGIAKVPLRRAALGLVPAPILARPKSGFGGPARAWFRDQRSCGLSDRVAALGDTGLVHKPPALRLVAQTRAGYLDSALAAWALVCLEAWWREHGISRPQCFPAEIPGKDS
jgi:asparagine synthase (glutamine-hydrolysing)